MNVVSFLFLIFFLFFLKPQSSHFRASPLSLICLRTQQILEIGTIWSALSRAPSPLLFPLAPEWRALVLSHNCWWRTGRLQCGVWSCCSTLWTVSYRRWQGCVLYPLGGPISAPCPALKPFGGWVSQAGSSGLTLCVWKLFKATSPW